LLRSNGSNSLELEELNGIVESLEQELASQNDGKLPDPPKSVTQQIEELLN